MYLFPSPMSPDICLVPSRAQTVWVEWGNEPWHTGFESGRYAQMQGLALGLGEQGAAWYGGATNEARLCYVGYRTAAVSRAWKAVFGSRVKVCVCATERSPQYSHLLQVFANSMGCLLATVGTSCQHLSCAYKATTVRVVVRVGVWATVRGVQIVLQTQFSWTLVTSKILSCGQAFQ